MTDTTRLNTLWIHQSAVVSQWRRGRTEGLATQGVDVVVVSAPRWNEGGATVTLDPGTLDAGTDEVVISAATIGKHPYLFVMNPVALWRALRRHRAAPFDLIDLHQEPAALVTFEVLLLARLAGVRVPVVCYSAQNIPKRYPPPFRWIERWVLRRIVAVHSCNEDVEDVLRAKGFSGEVLNLGLGVDIEIFPTGNESRNVHTASKADGGEPMLHVGYVGRIERRKGVFDLLDAVEDRPHIELTFVGAGPDADELQQCISASGQPDRVHIEGFVHPDDLPACYRSFDVLIVPSIDQPSWKEQFGRVAVEAMAAGTPVVVSDAGSLPEVVADAGVVVPQNNPEALGRALEELRLSPDKLVAMSIAGLERAKTFSWAAITERQAAMYRRVVQAADKP